jgi:hypothetical protein
MVKITSQDQGDETDLEKPPEKKINSPIADLDEASLREISESARFLVVVLIQTLKAFRLYEPEHPILSRFLDRLSKVFDRYFKEYDVFSLQIKEHQLFHRKKVVYENKDIKESLAFLFFKDGIREIRFHRGIELSELIAFLNVVRKSDRISRLRDDLVTLFWQSNFSHIDITSVEDFLEGGGTVVPTTQDQLTQGLGFGFRPESGKRSDSETANAFILEELQEITANPDQSLIEACQLNVSEMEKMNLETQQEETPDLIALVDDLIEILLHLSEEMDAYENIIAYFEQVFLKFYEWGEMGKVVAVLRNLKNILLTMGLRDKQIFAINRILEIPSGPQFVKLLGHTVKTDKGEPELTLQVFQLLTKQAIGPLFQMFQELRQGKWKSLVKEYLIDLSKESIDPLTKLIPESRPGVILQILDILEKVGHPSSVRHATSLISHETREVREATLRFLSKFEEKRIVHIKKFLDDPEPDIRGKAAFLLAQLGREQAVKPLSNIIFSPDFHKRAYKEKASFIRALGETRSEEALSLLKKISKKGRWFRKEKWLEMQRCANLTLKSIESYASYRPGPNEGR